jgi:hypothetical protein
MVMRLGGVLLVVLLKDVFYRPFVIEERGLQFGFWAWLEFLSVLDILYIIFYEIFTG